VPEPEVGPYGSPLGTDLAFGNIIDAEAAQSESGHACAVHLSVKARQAGGSTTVHAMALVDATPPAFAVTLGHVPTGRPPASPDVAVTIPEPLPTVAERDVKLAGSVHPCAVETLSAQ
jgi:hypothetical protein